MSASVPTLESVWSTLTSQNAPVSVSILTTALSMGQPWQHLHQQWEQVVALTLAPASAHSITHDEYKAFITRFGPWKKLYIKTTAVCQPSSGSTPVSLVPWFHASAIPSAVSPSIHFQSQGGFILHQHPHSHVIENDQTDDYHLVSSDTSYYFPHLADLISHHIPNSTFSSYISQWNTLLKSSKKHVTHDDESRIRFNHDETNVRFREGSISSVASVASTDDDSSSQASGPTFHRGTLKLDKIKGPAGQHKGVAFHSGIMGAKTMRFRLDDQGRLVDEHGKIHIPDPDDEPELEGLSIHDTDPESVLDELAHLKQELSNVQIHVSNLQSRIEQLTQIVQKQQDCHKTS